MTAGVMISFITVIFLCSILRFIKDLPVWPTNIVYYLHFISSSPSHYLLCLCPGFLPQISYQFPSIIYILDLRRNRHVWTRMCRRWAPFNVQHRSGGDRRSQTTRSGNNEKWLTDVNTNDSNCLKKGIVIPIDLSYFRLSKSKIIIKKL